jgi:hypothetical protein
MAARSRAMRHGATVAPEQRLTSSSDGGDSLVATGYRVGQTLRNAEQLDEDHTP